MNNGTKKKDLDKTGYKGLGFKAVFGKSDMVMVYSNEEYFRFDSLYQIQWNKQWGTDDQQTWERKHDRQFIYPWQINPIYTDQHDVPQSLRQFLRRKRSRVACMILLNNIEEIYLAMTQLSQQPSMFMFLRSISQIIFSMKDIDVTISIDGKSNHGCKTICSNGNFNSKSMWLVKCFVLDVPEEIRTQLLDDSKAPEKLKAIRKAEIFFAVKQTNERSDEIERLAEQDSILFSYLPTKISEYKFPVLINANFLTNVNREQIHTGRMFSLDSVFDRTLISRFCMESVVIREDR